MSSAVNVFVQTNPDRIEDLRIRLTIEDQSLFPKSTATQLPEIKEIVICDQLLKSAKRNACIEELGHSFEHTFAS